MIVPFIIIYIFNWIIFAIIMFSLLRKHFTVQKDVKKEKKQNISFVRQQLIIVATLSVLFGLGWGLGLLATENAYDNNSKGVRDLFASLFVILTSFHGLFIFVMHCLRSPDVRKVWKFWFHKTTGKDFTELSTAAYGSVRNRLDTTRSTTDYSQDTLRRNVAKSKTGASPISPDVNSSVFTYPDESEVKVDLAARNLAYQTSKEGKNLEEAITLETIQEFDKKNELSKEEESTLSCDQQQEDDIDKKEIA